MNPNITRWLIAGLYVLMTIVDIIDGNALKIITTTLVSISIIAFSFGYGKPAQSKWFKVGFVFAAFALCGVIYRIFIYPQHG